MHKKIIRSQKTIERNPFAAFFLSLVFTGTGEMYCGKWASGFILFLLRTIPLAVLPAYIQINPRPSYLYITVFMLLFSFVITLISPFKALMMSINKKTIIRKKYNAPAWYIAYILLNLGISIITLAVFFTFISFRQIRTENTSPVISAGDIVIIKKYNPTGFAKGDVLLFQGEKGAMPARLIALNGNAVTIRDQDLLVNGHPLKRDALSENEMSGLDAAYTEFLVSEEIDNRRYAVMIDTTRRKQTVKSESFMVSEGHYFMACDNRLMENPYTTIAGSAAESRIEGVLFSPKLKRLLITTFLKNVRP